MKKLALQLDKKEVKQDKLSRKAENKYSWTDYSTKWTYWKQEKDDHYTLASKKILQA